MTYLSDKLALWEEGPYAMQAMLGFVIENKPGEWFVQLRVPAESLFDQIVLSNAWGNTREEAIEKARVFAGADEVIEFRGKARMTATGAWFPRSKGGDLLGAMQRCGDAIALLCHEINKHHDEI